MSARRQSWCVVGGGMLGQALALRLAGAGHSVTLLEAGAHPGGLAAAANLDGLTFDRYYHVILPRDRRLLALLAELGLQDEIVWRRSRTGFFANGAIAPLNGAMDYLRLPVLGPVAKARLAFTLMMASRIADGRPLAAIPVETWLARWSGRAAFEGLWRPLLRAKLGENYRHASAAFIWASIRRLYLAREGRAKTETLGFVAGGYARILERLGARLAAVGVTVCTGCKVSAIRPHGAGLSVETAAGPRRFDAVVSTLPPALSARLCEALAPELRARLEAVLYQGVICATLVLERPLGEAYLTYLLDRDLPFTAVVEMTALTGTERFGGRSLLYLPRYATESDPFWELDDASVRKRFLDDLGKVFAHFDRRTVRAAAISRARHVMAVPTVGYDALVPPTRTNVPGLFLVNSAQITDGTLNVDATLGVIDRAWPELARDGRTPAVELAA